MRLNANQKRALIPIALMWAIVAWAAWVVLYDAPVLESTRTSRSICMDIHRNSVSGLVVDASGREWAVEVYCEHQYEGNKL